MELAASAAPFKVNSLRPSESAVQLDRISFCLLDENSSSSTHRHSVVSARVHQALRRDSVHFAQMREGSRRVVDLGSNGLQSSHSTIV
jgi:hypothetical protein